MKNKIWIVVFFFVTFLIMIPPRDTRDDGFHSSELKLQNIDTDTFTISAYTDEEGRIIKPANVGYSVIIKNKDANGRNVLERYFLTKSVKTLAELEAMDVTAVEQALAPEEQWGKHYGMSREYNDAGECVSYSYLDSKGKRMDIPSGFCSVVTEYDEYHRRVKEMFYTASGEPTENTSKVWGQAFTYYSCDQAAMGEAEPEEVKPSWLIETVTSLNQAGEPMESSSGYATVRRFYGKDKRTSRELFYDCDGQPTANKFGAYGQDYTYDELGRQITCTYLDREYNPTLCNKGYSKLVRTYFKSNAAKTEMFFVLDGSPAVLAHGESGNYYKSTATQYLNADGRAIFVLDNFLRGNPLLVIGFAIIIWVISSRLNKKWNTVLLIAYVLFILYMTLFSREFAEEAIKLNFWETVKNMLGSYGMRVQVIENIYLFLPFGVILYHLTGSRKVVLLGVLFSIVIEVTQYVGHLGSAEVMDVLTNGVGAAVGVGMGKKNSIILTKGIE